MLLQQLPPPSTPLHAQDGCNLSPSACSQLTLHSGLRVHDADAMTFLDAAAPHTLVANRRSSGALCCVCVYLSLILLSLQHMILPQLGIMIFWLHWLLAV
jgi:hypothetical protein